MHKARWTFFFLPLVFLYCSNDSARTLNIAGSDTVLELSQAQAEVFYDKTGIPVNITGGGSGVGINLAKEKSIDIANSSRELSKEEEEPQLVQAVIANDLIAIVTHKENPIRSLSRKQLSDIYTGHIRNWEELGWKNLPVSLYGRQNSSGTYRYFQETVLHKANYSPRVKEMTGNAQLIRSLKEDIAGIAYVSYGYYFLERGSLNLIAIDGITPSLDRNMKHYYLKRGVYEVFRKDGGAKISLVRQWFNYLLGEGKKEVLKMGFLPLDQEQLAESKKNVGIA